MLTRERLIGTVANSFGNGKNFTEKRLDKAELFKKKVLDRIYEKIRESK